MWSDMLQNHYSANTGPLNGAYETAKDRANVDHPLNDYASLQEITGRLNEIELVLTQIFARKYGPTETCKGDSCPRPEPSLCELIIESRFTASRALNMAIELRDRLG